MKLLRTLIVDDEPLARERLRRLIEAAGRAHVRIMGECGSGTEAIERLQQGGVDLLFVDMEMPGASGMDVIAQLPADERPAVVFATAHENFAVDAFDVQAVDYLLKPFDQERFELALDRAESFWRARAGDERATPDQAVSAAEKRTDRFSFKVDGRIVFLKPTEIHWVEAADNYVVLHVAGEESRLMLRETMTALEKRLGPEQFVRVNRSAIVQLDQIKELQPGAHGDYTLVLHDGTKLPLSRSLRGKLDTLFGPGLG